MKIVLAVAYLSMFGEASITVTEFPTMKECQVEAKRIFNNVKAGSARVWCKSVIAGGRYASN